MYTLKTEHSFDAAHFLAGYSGKCSNIHGHRWRVTAEVKSKKLHSGGQLRGMVVDFGDLKEDLRAEADYFDHAFIVEKGSLQAETMKALLSEDFKIIETDFRTTAENFAKYFYDRMSARGYEVNRIEVYETPNNCASYVNTEV